VVIMHTSMRYQMDAVLSARILATDTSQYKENMRCDVLTAVIINRTIFNVSEENTASIFRVKQ
jgi:hypothetical protein